MVMSEWALCRSKMYSFSIEIPLEYGIYAPFMLQGVHYAIYALGSVLCQKHEEHKIDGPTYNTS